MIIWLASYPKSGNTFLRSIIASLIYSEDGNFEMDARIPESFNVLTKEIRSLGIDIDLESIESQEN